MADWDQSPAYPEGASEGQQGEGGPNHNNNCVPTALGWNVRALGGPEIEPQAVTDAVYGPGHLGGEDIGAVADYFRRVWPQAPAYSLFNPAATLDAIDRAAVQDHPVSVLLHCDGYGTIQPVETGIFHECAVVAHQGDSVLVKQSETGAVVTLTSSFFAQATSGNAGLTIEWLAPIVRTAAPTPTPTTPTGVNDLSPQDVSAIVKLAYEVRALRAFAEGKGYNPDGFRQDVVDATGFGNQVNAVVSGSSDLHSVVNAITTAG